MSSSPISIVIPNWNGADLLRRFLPSVLAELEKHNPKSECIVVDDGSTDDSAVLLQTQFPSIRLIRQTENRGFGSSANAGITQAVNDHVLLLNNDVAVTPEFLGPLLSTFDQGSDVFAVSAHQRQELPQGILHDGFNTAHWEKGHVEFRNATSEVLQGQQRSLAYCNGGCSLFSRAKLLEIGGFCELFDPFYYEDAELGLQAGRRGWKLKFAAESVVYHHHGTTTKRKPWMFRLVPVRNYFLLHWLVIDSRRLWREHICYVARRLFWWTLQGRIRYAAGFILALLKLPALIRERASRARGCKFQLHEVIKAWS